MYFLEYLLCIYNIYVKFLLKHIFKITLFRIEYIIMFNLVHQLSILQKISILLKYMTIQKIYIFSHIEISCMITILNCGSEWLSKRIGKYIALSGGNFQILPYTSSNSAEVLYSLKNSIPKGLIFTGSNDHIYNPGARQLPQMYGQWLISEKMPTLGICYGHQLLASMFGAKIIRSPSGFELGKKCLLMGDHDFPLFCGLPHEIKWMMLHMDIISSLPTNFRNFAATAKTPYAAIQLYESDKPMPVFGVQFHPEISPTKIAKRFFANFLDVCKSN